MTGESLTYTGEGLNKGNDYVGSARPGNNKIRFLKQENGNLWVLKRKIPGFLDLYKVVKAEYAEKFLETIKKMGY